MSRWDLEETKEALEILSRLRNPDVLHKVLLFAEYDKITWGIIEAYVGSKMESEHRERKGY